MKTCQANRDRRKTVPGTSSAYAERTTGGYYSILNHRIELTRYGLLSVTCWT